MGNATDGGFLSEKKVERGCGELGGSFVVALDAAMLVIRQLMKGWGLREGGWLWFIGKVVV